MEKIVISLGGSLIVPDQIQTSLLKKFKRIIKNHGKEYQFIIVTGGGKIARDYIKALKKAGKSEYFQGLIGISITRMNARFLNYLFGINNKQGIPHSIEEVEKQLKKQGIVICGGLGYKKEETSDTTSSKLAKHFNCDFINLTKVEGLYSKDPNKHKDAKFIPKISWQEFEKKTPKKYKPGQHFVLDQKAAKIIKRNEIKTYILGKNLNNLDKLLKGKKFIGTIIKD